MSISESITLVMSKKYDCKNSVRFNSSGDARLAPSGSLCEPPLVSVYLMKSAYATLGQPSSIAITISIVESENKK